MSFREDLITDSRLKAAKEKKLTPLKLNAQEQSAIFASSEGGFYDTTLENCSCADFAIQGHLQPCKHMIRLAMELGIIDNAEMQSDKNAALIKYHLGIFRDFVHDAPIRDVIDTARILIRIVEEGASVPLDVFEKSMDLPCITDFPIFRQKKDGTIAMNQKCSKDAYAAITLVKNRLAREAYDRIFDDRFVEALTTVS